MQTKVNSKSLTSALAKVAPAVKPSPSSPIYECVRLVVSGNQLTITGGNSDMEITAVIECETAKKGDGQCNVAFGRLTRAVSVMDGNIDVKHDKETITLVSGKTRIAYSTLSDDYPELEGATEFSEPVEIDGLITAISNVQACASEEKSRIILNSVRFDDGCILATDGRSLGHYDTPDCNLQLTVPIDLIRALLKTKPDSPSVSANESMVRFDSGDVIVTGKVHDTPFPNWRMGFFSAHKSILINREELLSVLDRGALVDEKRVTIAFKTDAIGVSSQSGVESADCETSCSEGFEHKTRCDPMYIRRALQSSAEVCVNIGVADESGRNSIVINAGKATHVICPMITREEKAE